MGSRLELKRRSFLRSDFEVDFGGLWGGVGGMCVGLWRLFEPADSACRDLTRPAPLRGPADYGKHSSE